MTKRRFFSRTRVLEYWVADLDGELFEKSLHGDEKVEVISEELPDWPASDAGIDLHASSIALRFPPHTWLDVEAAANAVDEAEGALRTGDVAKAWGAANVAVSISRRPLLPDFDGPWIDARRTTQQNLLRRAVECLASASEAGGDLSLAVQYAAEVIEIEPFRETGYQRLMRLHAKMGNRAEALRAFERCRQLLQEELGANPSPQTNEVFREILQVGD